MVFPFFWWAYTGCYTGCHKYVPIERDGLKGGSIGTDLTVTLADRDTIEMSSRFYGTQDRPRKHLFCQGCGFLQRPSSLALRNQMIFPVFERLRNLSRLEFMHVFAQKDRGRTCMLSYIVNQSRLTNQPQKLNEIVFSLTQTGTSL